MAIWKRSKWTTRILTMLAATYVTRHGMILQVSLYWLEASQALLVWFLVSHFLPGSLRLVKMQQLPNRLLEKFQWFEREYEGNSVFKINFFGGIWKRCIFVYLPTASECPWAFMIRLICFSPPIWIGFLQIWRKNLLMFYHGPLLVFKTYSLHLAFLEVFLQSLMMQTPGCRQCCSSRLLSLEVHFISQIQSLRLRVVRWYSPQPKRNTNLRFFGVERDR